MTPSQASAVSKAAPSVAIANAIRPTIRRSNMSAIAPAGVEIKATGNDKAVWTNATMLAEDVISVIDQAAPTPLIRSPRFERTLAVQMRRTVGCVSGENIPSSAGLLAPFMSVRFPPGLTRPAPPHRDP